MNPDARELLERFVAAVESGQVPGDADLADLAAAFNHILAGDDPKKALGLAGAKGRPKGGSWPAEVQVSELLLAGLTYDQACLQGVSVSRAQWYRLKKIYDPVIEFVTFLNSRPDKQSAKNAHEKLMANLAKSQ